MKQILRCAVYIGGLVLLSLGSVLNMKTGYGVSPINALPYALSEMLPLSLGGMTIILYSFYIGLQILFMKSRFRLAVLMQLPISVLFGNFTNFFNDNINYYPSAHAIRAPLLLGAIFVTSIGITMIISTQMEPVAPDGLTRELSRVLRRDFGFAKNLFDSFSCLAAIGAALLMSGSIIGVGIGTLISTLLTGRCIAWMSSRVSRSKSVMTADEAV